jgi:hypothetical protein
MTDEVPAVAMIITKRSADWDGPRPEFSRYAQCSVCGETVIYSIGTFAQARRETGVRPRFVCTRCAEREKIQADLVPEPDADARAQAAQIYGSDEAARAVYDSLVKRYRRGPL